MVIPALRAELVDFRKSRDLPEFGESGIQDGQALLQDFIPAIRSHRIAIHKRVVNSRAFPATEGRCGPLCGGRTMSGDDRFPKRQGAALRYGLRLRMNKSDQPAAVDRAAAENPPCPGTCR
jgi:hypothetical protein